MFYCLYSRTHVRRRPAKGSSLSGEDHQKYMITKNNKVEGSPKKAESSPNRDFSDKDVILERTLKPAAEVQNTKVGAPSPDLVIELLMLWAFTSEEQKSLFVVCRFINKNLFENMFFAYF